MMCSVHRSVAIAELLLLASLCACTLGRKESIEATVFFRAADGTPAADEEIEVVESLGDDMVVTDVIRADNLGRVFLQGRYCTPVILRAYGGSVYIKEDDPKTEFDVRLTAFRPKRSWNEWVRRQLRSQIFEVHFHTGRALRQPGIGRNCDQHPPP